MIAVINRLPVKEGMADQVVERFANGQGFVQDFPGFVSMEVLRSDDADEVIVITRWQSQEAFDSWVHSDEFKMAHGRGGAIGSKNSYGPMCEDSWSILGRFSHASAVSLRRMR
jgi:heme-degrading monooxygenase HmoA